MKPKKWSEHCIGNWVDDDAAQKTARLQTFYKCPYSVWAFSRIFRINFI